MKNVRAALHTCVDLLCNAIEADLAEATAVKAPRQKHKHVEAAPAPRPEMDPVLREQANHAMRKAGFYVPPGT